MIAARSIVAGVIAVAGCSSGMAADTFSPCPALPVECGVMPLGDSITDGYGTLGGYRIELFRQVLTAGQHMTFVGRNANGPLTVMVGTTTTPFSP